MAWLGLVSRENSSGPRKQYGGVTQAGKHPNVVVAIARELAGLSRDIGRRAMPGV